MPGRRLSAPQREVVKVVLLAGLVILLGAILFKDRWPKRENLRPEVFQEPVQDSESVPEPFDVSERGYAYTVRPVFRYEIWGLVVSAHYSGSFLDVAHETWKDYLNIKDFCLLWGHNLETDAYQKLRYWNRDFTCYYSWSDQASGQAFSSSHISNNHLITPDGGLRKIIKAAARGDQIHISGWLASYGHKGSNAVRGTSTTRDDTGNGACETIYVTSFEIIGRTNAGWRAAAPVSLAVIGGCLALLLFF